MKFIGHCRIRRRHHPDEKVTRRRLALMFTDIVDSTKRLVEVGDERWVSLLSWHNDLLRAAFAAHQGREVNQQGDGFLVVFEDPSRALQCGRCIQSRLAGGSPGGDRGIRVRIGIQWADVLESGDCYVGRGLHEAARISELAVGGEILVTVALLDAAGETSPPEGARVVELRGLPARYELVSVPRGIDRPYTTIAGALAQM
jgi:class 3 adenylate cyclase